MNNTFSRRLFATLALSAVVPFAAHANPAAGLPKGTIKLVVPFAAGGGVDTAARLLARQLQTAHGLTVVVDNRAGASGTVGGNHVKSAAPDGQTLLFSASTHVLAKEVLRQPPYDPLRDFSPVARVAEAPLLMVVAQNLPTRKLQDVIDGIKQQPDRWTAGLPAFGSASHVGTLLFAKQANVKLATVAYRGTAPALADVAGGHIQIMVDSIVSLLPMAKDGKVRAIATTSAKRSAIAPDIPTAAESGLPGLVYESWYGVWAPAGTPAATVEAWNRAINQAMSELNRSGALGPIGLEAVTETTEQFKLFVEADVNRSADLLRSSGFKPE
jgi:tripartite-type tricarboxylate transporter receptor subunit TctC